METQFVQNFNNSDRKFRVDAKNLPIDKRVVSFRVDHSEYNLLLYSRHLILFWEYEQTSERENEETHNIAIRYPLKKCERVNSPLPRHAPLSSLLILLHHVERLYGTRKSAATSLILRLASAWLGGDITPRRRSVWGWNLVAAVTTCGYYDFATLSRTVRHRVLQFHSGRPLRENVPPAF